MCNIDTILPFAANDACNPRKLVVCAMDLVSHGALAYLETLGKHRDSDRLSVLDHIYKLLDASIHVLLLSLRLV